MSARAGQSWQTSLADLSLILFMATAAAVSHQPAKPPKSQASAAPSPQTEPLSVYVAAPDAPPLAQWLQEQAADPRQQLTITARYGAGARAQSRALAEAMQLLKEAGTQGRAARIVVEPGDGSVRAVLAYDSPHEGKSRGQ
ncbi:MAG: hypothetical protein P8Y58_07250 [Novosphingobium sp.]